jgi:uncharacterized membrane protein YccC
VVRFLLRASSEGDYAPMGEPDTAVCGRTSSRGVTVRLGKRLLQPVVMVRPGHPAFKKAAFVCLGFVVPMAVCTYFAELTMGTVSGMSGMLVVLADPGGAFQRRAKIAPAGVLLGAVVLFVMLLFSASAVISILLVGIFILVSGFFLLYGTAGGSVANPIQLMLLLGLALPTGDLATSAALFAVSIAGIGWGTLVVLAPWPFVGSQPVWRVFAEAFEVTARVADGIAVVTASTDQELADRGLLRDWDDNRSDLAPAYKKADDNAQYLTLHGIPARVVLNELDELAAGIMAFSTRFNESHNTSGVSRAALAKDFTALANALRDDARRVKIGQLPAGNPPGLPAIRALANSAADSVLARLSQAIIAGIAGLQTIKSSRAPRLAEPRPKPSVIASVRSSISADSVVFRHVARFAITAMVAVAIFRLFDVPDGAWIFLTVIVVLKPGIGSTIDRILQRTIGTMLGVVLAAGLVSLLTGRIWLIVIVMTVLLFIMVSTAPLNYLFWAVAITPFVLLGIDAAVPHDYADVAWRLLNTIIGAGLSLLATYTLWPSRGAQIVPRAIARAYGAVDETLCSLTNQPDTQQARELHRTSRAAEANARSLLGEMENEPAVALETVDQDRTMLWGLTRIRTRVLTAIIEIDQRRQYPLTDSELASAGDARTAVQALAQTALSIPVPTPVADTKLPEVKDASPDSVDSDFVGMQDVAAAVAVKLEKLTRDTKMTL